MPSAKLTTHIVGHEKDLGGFTVRRILPAVGRKMVGPFVFFDHMGPAQFPAGQGMDVRPHPHIGLATVTLLFDGAILHRDSLGSEQVIRPGDINWMTAGSGIVHSERTPADFRRSGGRVEGIQTWIALPREAEETAPSFVHHPAPTLPSFAIEGVNVKVLVGSIWTYTSPVRTFSDMLYLDIRMPAGSSLKVPAGARELGVYLVAGELRIEDVSPVVGSLLIGEPGADMHIQCTVDAHLLVIGGIPLPEGRTIWWNFVSSSPERIERAKADWRERRFPLVPGDELEFIPLPDEVPPPAGTIL